MTAKIGARIQSRMDFVNICSLTPSSAQKATGEDPGYAHSFYEADLPPGRGIPLHSHTYAEIFYVNAGHTDFLRVDEDDQEEWVRCGPGDTAIAPINALHAFHS